ncbi:MAG: alanine dehydrogenase, partial [Pseudomonadota bacterium]|nr:alanine dehydrogenase [Pseudomonadota bacterium]
LADKGAEQAMKDDPHLRTGLNVHHGKITHEAVAKALDAPFIPAEDALGI